MSDSSPETVSSEALAEDTGSIVAESPAANEEGGSYLDAVMGALEDGKEKSPGSETVAAKAPEAQTPEAKADGAKIPDPDDMSEDEIARSHVKTQKQIRKLLRERSELRDQVSGLEPRARQAEEIVNRIRGTGLDGADLDVLFKIGSLMKSGNLIEAQRELAPIWEAVQNATGAVLPADLQTLVDNRQIHPEHAQQIVKERARANLLEQQHGIREQRNAQEQSERFVGTVVANVNDWEQGKKRSDPDWNLKAPDVRQEIELRLLRGEKPRSEQEALSWAEDALKSVNAKFAKLRPAPRAVRPPIGGTSNPNRSTTEPKTHLDVVMQMAGLS